LDGYADSPLLVERLREVGAGILERRTEGLLSAANEQPDQARFPPAAVLEERFQLDEWMAEAMEFRDQEAQMIAAVAR
jgi:hypothetical protein